MRLKILQLEGLCVTIPAYFLEWHFDDKGSLVYPDLNDPELMEFAPLVLEFLKTQASTLEYLKLDLFTERDCQLPDIPTDVLVNHFPRMPNLISFVIGSGGVGASRTDFPFQMSTVAELFPKLRNLENIQFDRDDIFYDEDFYAGVDEFEAKEGDEDFPANYPVSPNANFSLKNIRGVEISPILPQLFPFITELHLQWNIWDRHYGTIGIIRNIHKIPCCLPRLKHFYHNVNMDNYEENEGLKLMRILNGFMTGISSEEYQRTVEDHDALQGFQYLSQVQFARSRPSIFDLKELETLDIKFLCKEFRSETEAESSRRILPAIEALISWGLSRMTHLKKLRFQFEEQRMNSGNRLPDSCDTLLETFRNRDNLEIHSLGYDASEWPKGVLVEQKWNFELNLQHHTSSEYEQLKFFSEDPDIWDLGLRC